MMKDFLDKHKGKICFVLGSGPSLRHLDAEAIKPYIVIAVNAAILKAPTAQYYFSNDYSCTLLKYWLMLKTLECELILNMTTGGFGAYESKTGMRVFEGIDLNRITYFEVERKLKMDKEANKLKLDSSSSHTAVHFAHILGCNPIVLLGCDCQYENNHKHFYDFPNQPDGDYIKPEFAKLTPDWTGAKSGNTDGEQHHHYNAWQKVRKNNPNINIINASGGRLSMFPRMSLEEILK